MARRPYVTLADLVEEISQRAGTSLKDTHSVLNNFYDIVRESILEGVEVQMKGIGSFSYRDNVPMRNVTVYSPRYKKKVFMEETKGYRVPTFHFSAGWREFIKEKTLVTYQEIFGEDKKDE